MSATVASFTSKVRFMPLQYRQVRAKCSCQLVTCVCLELCSLYDVNACHAIMKQVLKAVVAIHQQKIMHRDLKVAISPVLSSYLQQLSCSSYVSAEEHLPDVRRREDACEDRRLRSESTSSRRDAFTPLHSRHSPPRCRMPHSTRRRP